jgi:acid phosphatase type 7
MSRAGWLQRFSRAARTRAARTGLRTFARQKPLAAPAVLAVAGAALTFLVGAAPAVPGAGTYRDEVLADNPSSYWRLGETSGTTAVDERASANGGYVNGVALGQTGALANDTNGAVSFDGVNDHVLVPYTSSLDLTTAVSVEAWIKRSKPGWQVVVGKPGHAQSKHENYAIWFNSTNRVVAYFGNGTRYASVTSTPVDTNWHHVVATYDNATAKLYLDGSLATSTTSDIQMTANTLPLNMGRSTTGSYFFGGQLDEVAVYATVLSSARVQAHYDVGRAIDRDPPVVSLDAPAHASSTSDTTPTFSGIAGTATGDSATVTVRLYSGLDALGTPLQTLTTTRAGSSYAVDASALAAGTYTAQAEQADAGGRIGRSSANSFSVNALAPSSERVLIGAGDIASCTETGDSATGALLPNFPNAVVATFADNAYPLGTAQQFADCYDPTWGSARLRTRPSVGTHDYGEAQGGSLSGYTSYFASTLALFGPSASDPSRAYYSYDIGAWHVVVLNAACFYYAPGCSETGQEQWLRSDLTSRPAQCTLAYWHNPFFTSGAAHAGDPRMQRYWNVLYELGADMIVNGHNHQYERFAPQTPSGVADPTYGIREFVVGTGGAEHYGFSTIKPNSEVRNGDTFGLIKLTLRPTGYDWEFVPEAGRTFTDSGSQSCHGAPPGSQASSSRDLPAPEILTHHH